MILLLAVLSAATPETRFADAIAREAAGDVVGARDALMELAKDDGVIADEALFEAAQICENKIGAPTRAQVLYQELLRRFPQSHLWRRAKARVDFLSHALKSGEVALQEFFAVTSSNLLAEQRAERLEALLKATPNFALADEALFRLASSYAECGKDSLALDRLLVLDARLANPWSWRGKKLRADLLTKQHHYFAARVTYQALAQSADAVERSSGREGLAQLEKVLTRACAVLIAFGYWMAFFVVCWRRDGMPRRPPSEVLFLFPVAAIFALAALGAHNRAVALAIVLLSGGTLAVLWIAQACARSLRSAASLALAVLCAFVFAIEVSGLHDLVIATLRFGPDR